MRRAIAADFHSLEDVDVVMTLDRRFADESNPWKTVLVGPRLELEIFQALANDVDYIVCIAPETGGILEARAALIEETTGRSLGSSHEAIGIVTDKLGLSKRFEENGIATPPTRAFVVSEGLPEDLGFPCVVKPIDGAGSQLTFLIQSRSEWAPTSELPERMLVQPFVQGIPMSASFLVDRQGVAQVLGVGRQHLTTRGREIRYAGGSMPEPDALALGEPRAAIEAVKGLRGFVGVDFIVDPRSGTMTVIEINPRPTTSFVGLQYRYGLGKIAGAWLDSVGAVGQALQKTPPTSVEPFRFHADGTIERHAI